MLNLLECMMRSFKLSMFIRLLNISLCSLMPGIAFADNAPGVSTEPSLATDIADSYLRSFPSMAEEEEEEKAPKRKRKKKRFVKVTPPKLDELTKRKVVLNKLFTKSNTFALIAQHSAPLLNAYAWDDLKLFYGTTSQPDYHLISCINRTITTLGEGVLATMLVTPTTDIQDLYNRQNIIKTILEQPATQQQLQGYLRRHKAVEQNILSLWTRTDPLYSKSYVDYMDRKFYFKNKAANQSAARLEFKKRYRRDFWNIGFNWLWPCMLLGNKDNLGMFIPFYNFHWLKERWPEANADNYMWPALFTSMYVLNATSGVTNYKDYAAALRYMALRMADLQTFLITAQQLSECVAASPALEGVYGDRLARLRVLLSQGNEDTAFGKLIHRLQTLPLHSWSYFFSNAGKLLASYKVFLEYKDQFADAFYDVGQLDVFLSIAQLMQESQDYSDNAYVFTQFLDPNETPKPYIKLAGMWNPFIDAQKAVPNTVEMGAELGVRTIVLTGPNAGGKSTFLTGVTLSLLLSQTFGIAPCKVAIITPFNKLNTYINIADDIAAGKSLFMAEAARAQKHIEILEGLPKTEFSFSIMDELFSGTNPKEGEAAAYSIMEYMGKYDNALNIIATHFPRVMLLEKNVLGFVNYKVFITYEGPSKKLNYTYKVIPGRSNQAIAIDILQEQGYNTKMLQRARDIIAHPEKYPASF